ncbi:MAG: hypothetical protein GVY30_11810 [Chloroflexi bacterium]|jgi:hypothetical protein|nr:hypothetical protein [Chloroflexota bacterium]
MKNLTAYAQTEDAADATKVVEFLEYEGYKADVLKVEDGPEGIRATYEEQKEDHVTLIIELTDYEIDAIEEQRMPRVTSGAEIDFALDAIPT